MKFSFGMDQEPPRLFTGRLVRSAVVLLLLNCGNLAIAEQNNQNQEDPMKQNSKKNPAVTGRVPDSEIPKTNVEWRKRLTPEQFEIARKKGTERAFPAHTGTQKRLVHIAVFAAENPYSAPVRNLKVDVAGQVFMHQLMQKKRTPKGTLLLNMKIVHSLASQGLASVLK